MKQKLQWKEPIRLTEAAISKLKIPAGKTEETWFDDEIKGFGVRKRGDTAVYILQYQLNGKTSKLTLGKCSEIRCGVARDLAKAKRGDISKAKNGLGVDPAIERENIKAEAQRPKSKTLGATIADYLEDRRGKISHSYYVGLAYQLQTLLKNLHGLALGDVNRAAIAVEIRTITKERGTVTANRTRTSLSAFFRWAIGEGLCDNNPVVGTNQHEEIPRDRALIKVNEDGTIDWGELVSVWMSLPSNEYGNIIKLLTLTGCRLDEIGSLRWSEIDTVKTRTITLPPERTKNKQEHIVPLSGAALEILGAIPRRADRDLVFGIGAGGYGGWSSAKAKLDKVVNLKTPWRVHDLRRTVRTGLGAIGVLRHVSEAVLNHKEDKLIRTYDRNPYTAEKRAALELWASQLAVAIAQAEGANITALRRNAG
jgi:integrase